MTRYATTDELRDEIDLDAADATTISVLEAVLDAASLNIDLVCNRPFGFLAADEAVGRQFPGSGTGYQRILECVEIVEIATRTSGLATAWDWWTSPTTLPMLETIPDGDWIPYTGSSERPYFDVTPYTSLMVNPSGDYSFFPKSDTNAPTVLVLAYWGYAATIPFVIKQACIMQAARWFKRLQGAMSDSLASGDVGRLLYRKALDPAIERLLDHGRMIKPAIGGR